VTCDGRLFHRRAAATGNAQSPSVDRRVGRTPKNVEEEERNYLRKYPGNDFEKRWVSVAGGM